MNSVVRGLRSENGHHEGSEDSLCLLVGLLGQLSDDPDDVRPLRACARRYLYGTVVF